MGNLKSWRHERKQTRISCLIPLDSQLLPNFDREKVILIINRRISGVIYILNKDDSELKTWEEISGQISSPLYLNFEGSELMRVSSC